MITVINAEYMGSNGNNSVIIVSELFEALKSQQPKKIMMDGIFIILMITKYGKVENELFNQVRQQGKVNIRKFELCGNESEFFIDRSEPDIYYSTWGNDYYYPCHRRLMQACLRIISPDDM